MDVGDVESARAAGEATKVTFTPSKRGRAPPATKSVKWQDIPNWYSRTDCPLLQLPGEVLDRIFALETGLGVRDYVALAGVNRMFRSQLDDAVFKEICLHHKVADTPELPPSGVPLTSQIFTRDVGEWKVPKEIIRLRAIPSQTYRPRGERSNWSRPQYAVYRQERDIHLATHRLKRYEAAFEASVKRKKVIGKPMHHPPVKDGTATRQVIGVVNGSRPGERPFGPKLESGDQSVARYDVTAAERRILRGREWTKEHLDGLEEHLKGLIKQAECPDPEASNEETSAEPRRRRLARPLPWSVPPTPDDSDDEVDAFEWDEEGNKVVHDFWPSTWREKAAVSLSAQRINKTTANDKYKLTDAELATLRHVLAANPLNKATPRRLFLQTAVEALAYRVHGGPLGHAAHVAKMMERINKGRETRKAKRAGDDEGATYRKPKHWKG